MNYRNWTSATARGRMLAGVALLAGTMALVACDNDKPAPVPTPAPTTPAPPPPVAFCDPALPAPSASPAPGAAINWQTGDGYRIRIHNGVLTVQAPATQTTEDFRYASHGTCDVLGGRVLRTWAGDRRSITLPGGAKLTMHGQAQKLLRVSLYDGATSREADVLTHTIMHDSSDAAVARNRDAAEHDGETANLTAQQSKTVNDPVTRTHSLQLTNIYTEAAGTGGLPQARIIAPQILGWQEASFTRVPILAPAAPAETDMTCDTLAEPRGGLTRKATGQLDYLSRSGRWLVKIDRSTIIINYVGPDSMSVEHWGDPHENLNGKHLKDWETARRTMILSDGTKITLHADGPQHVVHTVSIYDGSQSHEIGNAGNVIRHSCVNRTVAMQRETQEADGETALITMMRSPQSTVGGLVYLNVYNEPVVAGGTLERIIALTLLGTTGEGDINPKQVNDLYDDPRLAHT